MPDRCQQWPTHQPPVQKNMARLMSLRLACVHVSQRAHVAPIMVASLSDSELLALNPNSRSALLTSSSRRG
jgi:hypothetical protein